MINSQTIYFKYNSIKFGWQLKANKVDCSKIKKAQIVLICCQRNDKIRLKHFLDYYRNLGVEHFLFIDNDSSDSSLDYLSSFNDISTWTSNYSYKKSNFGMHWCNYLLNKFCQKKWCIVVDSDEYLVYPNSEKRNLTSLLYYMKGNGQRSLFTPIVDMYSNKKISETIIKEGDNPLEVCNYFDKYNYVCNFDSYSKSLWLQGGPRRRVFFQNTPKLSPALNKISVVFWNKDYFYTSSMHQLIPISLNSNFLNNISIVTGALLHFKFLSTLETKAIEERIRKQHYDDSREFESYLGNINENLHDKEISTLYSNSQTLLKEGIIQKGHWY